MKRPNSAPRTGDRPSKAAAKAPKPKAPVSTNRSSAAPKSVKKPALSVVRELPDARRLDREQQRLKALAKIDKRERRSLAREQLSQIRKFTQANRLRRIVTLSSLGSVAVLIALVLATMFTPLMAVQEIQVTGLHRLKAAQIQTAVKGLMGKPLTMIDDAQLVARLSGFALIESFSTVALPPHTLQLNIQERQPIGVVSFGGNKYLYDPAGVQISPVANTSRYPTIIVSGNPAHSSNFRAAVDVLLALPATLYPSIYSIQATSKDDVRLTLRGVSNRRILWGDSARSLLKSKVLAALMKNVKHTATVTFDVSSPTAPTVRYGAY